MYASVFLFRRREFFLSQQARFSQRSCYCEKFLHCAIVTSAPAFCHSLFFWGNFMFNRQSLHIALLVWGGFSVSLHLFAFLSVRDFPQRRSIGFSVSSYPAQFYYLPMQSHGAFAGTAALRLIMPFASAIILSLRLPIFCCCFFMAIFAAVCFRIIALRPPIGIEIFHIFGSALFLY